MNDAIIPIPIPVPLAGAPHGQHHQDLSGWLGFVASLWWAVVSGVHENGPPWQVVPPLLFGLAAVWNARTNARRAAESARPEGPKP